MYLYFPVRKSPLERLCLYLIEKFPPFHSVLHLFVATLFCVPAALALPPSHPPSTPPSLLPPPP